jgi:hypothetical protein
MAWQRVGWQAILTLTLGTVFPSQQSQAAELPPELVAVKAEILAITAANTNNTDNIAAVRAELEPLIAQLETWFNANRPANEVTLTQVPWKNLWYDDPDISFDLQIGPLQLIQPRDQIYQVIENGYYYNVSEFQIRLFRNTTTFTNFLKGAYTILRPATPENLGEPKLNTVDLEFVANSIRSGEIPTRIPLSTLVRNVDRGTYPTIPVPGPFGVTGELWNRYVDADLRIAAGFDDSEPETIDLYILRKVSNAD